MSIKVITPPSTLPITLEEAKEYLHVDHSVEDELIESLIRAALVFSENYCDKAFEEQTLEVTVDTFPDAEIELPRGPALFAVSVKYTDVEGDEITISEGDYVLDTASRDGWVVPVGDWPTTIDAINSVRIQYVAGAGTPPDVKQAIKMIVAYWYDFRQSQDDVPMAAKLLLGLNRRMYA